MNDSEMEMRRRFLQQLVDDNGSLLNQHYEFCSWAFDSGSFKEVRTDDGCFRSDLSELYIKWYYQIYDRRKSATHREAFN